LGYVTENLGKCDAIKIWEFEGDTGKAFTARVNYIPKMKPIEKKDFWYDLKDIANYDEKKGPIDNLRKQIRYAYAMKLTDNGFGKVVDLTERRNPGVIRRWINERKID